MSLIDEKSTSDAIVDSQNGLTLTRPQPARQHLGLVLSTIQDVDSTHSMSPPQSAVTEKHNLDALTPYQSYSHEARSDSKMNVNVSHSSFDNDLEAQGLTHEKTQASQCKTNLLTTKTKSCIDPAWPGRNHLKQQKKMAKRDRACCRPWASLSKKTKGIISGVILLVVLGVALGVGFGIKIVDKSWLVSFVDLSRDSTCVYPSTKTSDLDFEDPYFLYIFHERAALAIGRRFSSSSHSLFVRRFGCSGLLVLETISSDDRRRRIEMIVGNPLSALVTIFNG